ncbi:sigma-70 family RNA polymerase sigma factor [Coprothermobacter platensis]|uniref:sigma-70 family RNA polymerase sigma factor n=1 Tax=Coprothermobacter platensis TaxID=108819 RepID=UPI00039E36DD|nr:sigma-70 family RNA polymerase sigma factor [Coprothermobacter platensis]
MIEKGLIGAAKRGDDKAREQVLLGLERVIERQASQLTYYNIALEWDDLLAVGLIAANEAIDLYNMESEVPFESFVSRVIRNKMVDYLRSVGTFTKNDVAKYRQGQLTLSKEELSLEALIEQGIEEVGEQDIVLELDEALDKLPEKYKQILQFRYVDNLSVKEAADILGVTPGRVSQMVKEALDVLRESIGIKFNKGDGRC